MHRLVFFLQRKKKIKKRQRLVAVSLSSAVGLFKAFTH